MNKYDKFSNDDLFDLVEEAINGEIGEMCFKKLKERSILRKDDWRRWKETRELKADEEILTLYEIKKDHIETIEYQEAEIRQLKRQRFWFTFASAFMLISVYMNC